MPKSLEINAIAEMKLQQKWHQHYQPVIQWHLLNSD